MMGNNKSFCIEAVSGSSAICIYVYMYICTCIHIHHIHIQIYIHTPHRARNFNSSMFKIFCAVCTRGCVYCTSNFLACFQIKKMSVIYRTCSAQKLVGLQHIVFLALFHVHFLNRDDFCLKIHLFFLESVQKLVCVCVCVCV